MMEGFRKMGLDEKNPALYSMICWINDANMFSGTTGMTFDEFITYCIYFFTRRQHEEGIKYMFQMFDPEGKGFLTKKDFDGVANLEGLPLDANVIEEIFVKATRDGQRLYFSEFAFFM